MLYLLFSTTGILSIRVGQAWQDSAGRDHGHFKEVVKCHNPIFNALETAGHPFYVQRIRLN